MTKSERGTPIAALLVAIFAFGSGPPAHAFDLSHPIDSVEHSADKEAKKAERFVEKEVGNRKIERENKGIAAQTCAKRGDDGKCIQKLKIFGSDTFLVCTKHGVKAGICAKKGDISPSTAAAQPPQTSQH